ncbi:hypothetical protein QTN25_007827 [Entamoeba marina]
MFLQKRKLPNLKWKYQLTDDDGYRHVMKPDEYEATKDEDGKLVIFTNSDEYYGFNTVIMRSNVSKEEILAGLNWSLFHKLYLPRTLTEIPSRWIMVPRYQICMINEIHIPPSVETICDYAFWEFYRSNLFCIPPTVKYIGKEIFGGFGFAGDCGGPTKALVPNKTNCHVFAFSYYDRVSGFYTQGRVKISYY